MHEVDNQNGLLANCRFKQSSKSGMDYKITQLQAELHTGINPSSLEPCPIMTRRSVILCYGNHHFAPMTGTFVGKVLSTLSEYTHFKCAQILTPHELDDYCARFHGISSILFAGEALYSRGSAPGTPGRAREGALLARARMMTYDAPRVFPSSSARSPHLRRGTPAAAMPRNLT